MTWQGGLPLPLSDEERRRRAAIVSLDSIAGLLLRALDELGQTELEKSSRVARSLRSELKYAQREVDELVRAIEDGGVRPW